MYIHTHICILLLHTLLLLLLLLLILLSNISQQTTDGGQIKLSNPDPAKFFFFIASAHERPRHQIYKGGPADPA